MAAAFAMMQPAATAQQQVAATFAGQTPPSVLLERCQKSEKALRGRGGDRIKSQLAAGDVEQEQRPRFGWGIATLGAAATAALRARQHVRLGRRLRLHARGGEEAAKENSFKLPGIFSDGAFKQWTSWPTELGSGLTTAVVALPLAMAFGVASGAGALAGLYGAIFTGFFAALFGGTPAQVTGPTGPMTVVMASVIAKMGSLPLAFACVFFGGLWQILFGFLRLGGAIKLVPVTVLSGFMSGVGAIICSLQLPVMFGHSGGGAVLTAWGNMPAALAAPNMLSLIIGVFTLVVSYKFPDKYTFSVPKPLIALVCAATATGMMELNVPTLGAIPSGLPELVIPVVTAGAFNTILVTSLTLSLLGAIDSLLTSLVSDSLTSSFHDSNRELIGQGIGNAAAGLFGGTAGAGATMRTVVNAKTGGRTPVSGAFHSVCLLGIVLFLGPYARYIPLSCLAGILIKSGADVVDWPLIRKIGMLPKREVLIMLVTFLTTVFVDLIAAVVAGWVMAIFIDFYCNSNRQLSDKGVVVETDGEKAVVNLMGPVSFGAATGLLRILVPEVVGKKQVVLNFQSVVCIDTSAVLALQDLAGKIDKEGGKMYLCNLQPNTEGSRLLEDLGLMGDIANFSPDQTMEAALQA